MIHDEAYYADAAPFHNDFPAVHVTTLPVDITRPISAIACDCFAIIAPGEDVTVYDGEKNRKLSYHAAENFYWYVLNMMEVNR